MITMKERWSDFRLWMSVVLLGLAVINTVWYNAWRAAIIIGLCILNILFQTRWFVSKRRSHKEWMKSHRAYSEGLDLETEQVLDGFTAELEYLDHLRNGGDDFR